MKLEKKHQSESSIKGDFSTLEALTLGLSAKDKVNYLCLNFDPYKNQEQISEKEKILLMELGLDEFIADPYRLTRELLLLQERLSSTSDTD